MWANLTLNTMKRKNDSKKPLSKDKSAEEKIPDVKVEIKAKIIGYDEQGGTGPRYEPRYSMEDGSCRSPGGSIGMPW